MAEQRTSTALKLGAALLALVVVAGGAFLVIANVPTGGRVAIAAGVIWWIAASAFLARTLLRRRPGLRTPVRATLAVAALASVAAGFVVTRDKTVDEEVVQAAPAPTAPRAGADSPPPRNVRLLGGRFRGESGHDGEGDAAVVRLAKGGRMLTFTRFDVDRGGGDLRVYLHAGRTSSDDLGDFVEIAKLKGTRGNQQYAIPRGVDLDRYDTVVIWCVPFTTRIAQAPLG
jgi:hypothetical protein